MSKILVIDDETQIRDLCYDLFTKDGYEVITASRGDQALALILPEKPDLVLLDLNIPGEKKLSLLEKVRAKDPKLAIVVFSGNVTSDLEKQAFDAGAVEVLQKDIDTQQLRDKVRRILDCKNRLLGKKESEKHPEKILVVDDEDGIRNLLVDFFTHKGFQTISARNGEEALQKVKSEKPSVILLDINMPGMDGILTLKKIREIDVTVGVIMATSVQDESIAKEAMELGSYHYVLKPFDLQYLELVVMTRLVIAS